MKITKIKIKNLFGLSEYEADGKSVELTGQNGIGKTSVIDAIKYALTNRPDRQFVIKNGSNEGEIIIETDTGLLINRKLRTNQSDYKSIKDNGKEVPKPEGFLSEIFTPLQLDPVKFIQMDSKEQNRMILDLIDFEWNLNWIQEKFGEIPHGVNKEQNILQALNQIQSDGGSYFQNRQEINREIRHKKEFIQEITKDIPEHYTPDIWRNYSLSSIYQEIEEAREHNSKIENAARLKQAFEGRVRGFEAEKELKISEMNKNSAKYRNDLELENARLEAQINANREKIEKISEQKEERLKTIQAEFETKIANIDAEFEANKKYLELERIDFTEKQEEAKLAEKMKSHLNEYDRMKIYQKEVEELHSKAETLTRKIELARTLPAEILKNANLPIENLSISEEGIPLINGLPVSNLSEGEKLNLCIDIAVNKPNSLKIILIDGVEKLSSENRQKLYSKCKQKGLQFISTRTTDDNVLEVHHIN